MIKRAGIWMLTACVVLAAFAAAVTAEERPLIPDFSLESNRGEVVSLSDYAGEIVVLNFWATWCPHCRSEMPELQKLHDYFEETGAGKLLLINQIDGVRETRASAAKYLADNGLDLLNLYDDHTLVGYYIFGVPGLPATVVVDREGRLASAVLGPVGFEKLLEMIGEIE